MNYECDICGYLDAIEVPNCRHYTGGQPIHICSNCGFVYVKKEEVQMKLRALGLMKYFLINLIKILTQREYLQSKLDKLMLQIL